MLDKYFLQKFKLQGNHIYRMNHFTDNFDLDHDVTHYVCADYLHFNTSLKGKRAINRNKILIF